MKTSITTFILLFCIALNVFAQQELPMFFDKDFKLETGSFNRNVTYSPDGNRIAITHSNNRKISIWDTANGREITRLAGHSEPIFGIVFSPNSRQLVSCSGRDSNIKIWNAVTGELIRNIPQSGMGTAVSFSPDGSRIAGAYTGTDKSYGVKIWNTANGSEIRTLIHTAYIWSVTYSPDGKQILTASNDGIRIWDAGNGQTIRTINRGTPFGYAVYSPNARYIVAEESSETIRIFNTETGQEIISFPVELFPNDLIYSPDGRQLLLNAWIDNGNTKTIKIFDPDTGRELRSFNNEDSAIAYSADGRRILTNSVTFELTIAGTEYGASYATLLDATTGKVTGTIGYGPLNVGARAYSDMQIARFLGDTAAVNRHEAVLQFITGRGNATRAEIEKFYRDNVRSLIAAVVDDEFKGAEPPFPASTVTHVINSTTNFFTTPNQTNFNVLRSIHRSTSSNIAYLQQTYDADMANFANAQRLGQTDLAERFRRSARENPINEIRRQLNIPNDVPINWLFFRWAYMSTLRQLNNEPFKDWALID